MSHLEAHDILTDAQHWFRRRRSCETQLILTVQDLAQGIEDKQQIDVILLDSSKAFDMVPHRRLLHKLDYYGVRGMNRQWIAHFLHGREQTVVLDGASSPSAPVTSGVPQGTVLGPTVPGLHQRASHERDTLPSQTLRRRLHSVQEHQYTGRR